MKGTPYIVGIVALILLPTWSVTAGAQEPSRVPGNGLLNQTVPAALVEPEIHFDFTVNPFQRFSTAVRFSEKNAKAKLNIAPFQFRPHRTPLDGVVVNLVQAGEASTVGVGYTYDNSASYTRRRDVVLADLQQRHIPPPRPRAVTESLKDYTERLQKDSAAIYDTYTAFWNSVLRRSFAITFATNAQTFGLITRNHVDADQNGKVDNLYQLKAWDFSTGFLYRHTVTTSVSFSAHLTRKRSGAAEGATTSSYVGGALTFAHRMVVLDSSYRSSAAYHSDLFVPAVIGGVSTEYEDCRGPADRCEDRVTRQVVVTPYLDTRITPSTQFRIGLPIKFRDINDRGSAGFQPALQFGLGLGTS